MFKTASAFNQDISDWNISAVTSMGSMFDDATSLSDANKGRIQESFSSNSYWEHDWAEFIPPSNLNSTTTPTIAENQPIGTIVGEFNATDANDGNITYELVSGENNNSLFTLDTNGTLKTATAFDYESNASTYTITVQAKDELNATIEGNFTVTLTNVFEDLDGDGTEDFYDDDIDGDGFSNETELAYGSDPRDANSVANAPPADLNSTAPLTVAENQPIGTIVGEFNATDPDANFTLSYQFKNGENNNSLFSLDPNGSLSTAVEFDYENNDTHLIVEVEGVR